MIVAISLSGATRIGMILAALYLGIIAIVGIASFVPDRYWPTFNTAFLGSVATGAAAFLVGWNMAVWVGLLALLAAVTMAALCRHGNKSERLLRQMLEEEVPLA